MSLNGRVKRLEERAGTSPVDLEGRRKQTEELRAEIRARLERVLEEERRKGTPEPSEEQIAANVQQLRQALRRRAGLV